MNIFTFKSPEREEPSPSLDWEWPQEVLGAVKGLDIPRDKFVVVGGAVLQIWGYRKATDIDIVVEDDTLEEILKDGVKTKRYVERRNVDYPSYPNRFLLPGFGQLANIPEYREYADAEYYGIQLMRAPADELYEAPFEEIYAFTDELAGVLVATREKTLEWKQAVGRPKDILDAERLARNLKRSV